MNREAPRPRVARSGGPTYGKFDIDWMRDPELSPNARTLYCILVTFADLDDSRDNCFPTRQTLARMLGKSVDTVDRAMNELSAYGAVTVIAQYDPKYPKVRDANLYQLHDGDKWAGRWTPPEKPAEEKPSSGHGRKNAATPREGRKSKGGILAATGSRKDAPTGGRTGAAYTENQETKNQKTDDRRSSRRSRTTSGSRGAGAASSPKGSGNRPTGDTKPSPDAPTQTEATWSRDAYQVLSELRLLVATLPTAVQQGLGYVVDDTLASEGITVDQLAYRARTALAGTSPQLITDPVGWVRAHALVRRGCADPDCEAGVLYSAGAPCRACLERTTPHHTGTERIGADA